MSLKYKFMKAQEIIDQLRPKDRKRLERICGDIQAAEAALQTAARPLLRVCNTRCEGLCCRNIDPDSLISLEDMVYILAVDKAVSPVIQMALEKEKPFFTKKCIFLEEGIGPCIFRVDVRPEICVTSFCFSDTPVRKEIARVKRCFFKLVWFIAFRKIKLIRKFLYRFISRNNFRFL